MIVSDVKVPVSYTEEELFRAIRKAVKKKDLKIREYHILRRSIDARKKPSLFYVMKLLVNEKPAERKEHRIPEIPDDLTVVCGAGPAGLFAAMTLSEAGAKVLLVERGKKVEERAEDVERFFETGVLDPESNVQFGEGGAGTFSDGKLNTLTVDSSGLNERVLRRFTEAGAKEEILYDAKPHIGTDELRGIIKNFRETVLRNGGEIRYRTKLTDLLTENGKLYGIVLNGKEMIRCSRLILAIGHSARDTFFLLREKGVSMHAKSFAVGLRMEHPQEMITKDQYGSVDYEELGAAPYKVTAKTASGRGVYSFCMCPGGYVVNASSEEGHLCINGMSESRRDGKNANAAIIVQVNPEDYGSEGPLSGVIFQRELEKRAYELCQGKIPVQLYEDFQNNMESRKFGEYYPETKGAYAFGNLRKILPEEVSAALLEAIPKFGRMIKGFDRPDAILSGVEARTSSPVRIERNGEFQTNIEGIYPCGEGAGYAGGILSAAMDGIRTAEKILYRNQGES